MNIYNFFNWNFHSTIIFNNCFQNAGYISVHAKALSLEHFSLTYVMSDLWCLPDMSESVGRDLELRCPRTEQSSLLIAGVFKVY